MCSYLYRSFLAIVVSMTVVWSSACTPPASYPQTCADVQEQAIAQTGARPADGTYTLYVNSDASMPWEAFCRRMNLSSPEEYLTVTAENNFSQIGNGRFVASTSYRRYRIDPITLAINPLDDAFADNSGFDSFTPVLPSGLTHIPAGWAEFQPTRADDGPAAEANVSLAGTAFAFSESILANNLATFFCQASTPDAPSDAAGSGATVAADLTSFHLTAINSNSQALPSGVSTREVADCADLGPTADTFTTATWPLQYVGQP